MQEQTQERWRELAAQAVTERDPKKFMDLICELNRVLKERETRLMDRRSAQTIEKLDS